MLCHLPVGVQGGLLIRKLKTCCYMLFYFVSEIYPSLFVIVCLLGIVVSELCLRKNCIFNHEAKLSVLLLFCFQTRLPFNSAEQEFKSLD